MLIGGVSLAIRLLADSVVDPAVFGDEGPVGLMARHILTSGDRPIFYLGQPYVASLQAYLAAVFFALFGPSTAALRLAPLLVWTAYIVLVGWLAGKLVCARMAALAAVLASIAPPAVLVHAHLALGGTGAELLLAGTGTLAVAYRLGRGDGPGRRRLWFLALGFLFGVSLWIHFLAFVYVLAAVCYLLASHRFRLGALTPMFWLTPLGTVLGLVPALYWNIRNGWATIDFLRATLAGEMPHAPSNLTLLEKLGEIAGRGITASLGARNDWDGWIVLPWTENLPILSTAVVAVYAVASLWWIAVRWRGRGGAGAHPTDLIALVVGWNLVLFAPIPFQDEGPVIRYLLPLSGVLPIWAAWLCERLLRRSRWLLAMVVAILLVHNGYFSLLLLTSGTRYPIHALDRWLQESGISRVYAGYWIQWPLVFASNERVIASPRYGPDAGDRYPEYARIVDGSPDPVFVFDRNVPSAQRFAVRMAEMSISYRLDVVADRFLVYSCFSRDPRSEPIWP